MKNVIFLVYDLSVTTPAIFFSLSKTGPSEKSSLEFHGIRSRATRGVVVLTEES